MGLVRQRVRRGNKEDAQKLVTRLLACAMDIFQEGGIKAITMRSLAAHAGVSAMTPYRYFTNKAALLDAMLDFVANDLLALQRAAVDKKKGAQARLQASVTTYLDYWQAHPVRYRLIYMQTPSASEIAKRGSDNKALLSKVHDFSLQLTVELAQSMGVDSSRAEGAMRIRHFILLGYLHSNWINRVTSSQTKRLRGIVIEQAIDSTMWVLKGERP
jgi:AcrR family transcriptional regulator